MKEPRSKIHLLDCDEPLQAYVGITVRCGTVIQNGEAKWMLGDEFKSLSKIDQGDFQRGVCRACISLEPIGDEKRSRLYGLVEKESA